MSGLAWKISRLRAMGAGEVIYRLRQAVHAGLERRGHGRAQPRAPVGETGRPWLAALPRGFEAAAYQAAAARILAGRFDVFTLKDALLGFPPEWNRDPKTGIRAPLAFGKTLNYRDERVVGDIKYLWELNRHAELVTLAQAWHLTGEARYAEGCRTLLESWFEQCPYPLGANWTSSLEHGVRLANWAVAWGLLGGDLDSGLRRNDEFVRRWLDAIYRHCHFIAGHFSRHSSANNHLLGELMGLFIGATVWPLWPESARWRAQAAREFETEALKQNGTDGVNREQAIWYQHEVADMMLLVGLFGRANGVEFSAAYWQRLERMLEFIAALMDAGGNVPMIGDADDARLVRFEPGEMKALDSGLRRNDGGGGGVFRSLLATGAVLFGRGDFKEKVGRFDDKSRWLLGDAAGLTFDSLEAAPQAVARRDFPQGGYAILGDCFGTPEEIRIVADAGPLGYLSIAAHGHADALAFTLSVAGHELLIDPGTFVYQSDRGWRNYFKGTSAHNTLRVDGKDQSVPGGDFLWARHAHASCEQFETSPERDVWTGSHDGYMRLRDPVLHRRTIELDKRARLIRVTDRLECRGRHRVELFWHAHEDCSAEEHEAGVTLRNNRVVLNMAFRGASWQPKLAVGRMEPPLGWISRSFGAKIPCCTVVWAGDIDGSVELITIIEVRQSSDDFHFEQANQ